MRARALYHAQVVVNTINACEGQLCMPPLRY